MVRRGEKIKREREVKLAEIVEKIGRAREERERKRKRKKERERERERER